MFARFAKRIERWLFSIPYIFSIAFILFWSFYLNPNFLDSMFKGMSDSRVEDLSKTLIETTGILTSFLAVAGFYYLGKVGELFSLLLSNTSNLVSRVEIGRLEMEKLQDVTKKGELKLMILCDDCKRNSKCETQKNSSELIDKNNKTATNADRKLAEISQVLDGLDTIFIKRQNRTENSVLFNFLVTMVWFFSAIVTSIIAYVAQEPSWLQNSVYLIILGIVWTVITWVESYWEIKSFQKFNNILSKNFRDTDLMISSINSANNRVEYALDALSELICNTVKSRGKVEK